MGKLTDTSHAYSLKWIAAPRPPVHPNEAEGNQTFNTFDEAVTRMNGLASDSRFVSMTRITTTLEDVSEIARSAHNDWVRAGRAALEGET